MLLTIDEALDKLPIPTAKYKLAESMAEVERIVKRFGFPVVLKLVSPKVIHKTEAKGVMIAREMHEVRDAATRYLKVGKVMVQEHVSGVEMFIGIKKDPSFGHVLLTGIGGIFVEVYKDISFRVCPVTRGDAKEMLDELKGKAILRGVRGSRPVNEDFLIDALVNISKLPKQLPLLEELDINPFFINEKTGVAADARMVLKDNES